ncbi:uncharacterized protein K02A2.6-like [Armigeres subalbatus]|uniref:uncharacterized protein K02A2.6-like n=1 Tax=Armigeres subalbatus TaxID=124917 RepID=UPI002ED46F6B
MRSGGESLDDALRTFMQVYRTTPNSDLDGKSLAEVMFGRRIRTVSSLLLPQSGCRSPLTRKSRRQHESFNEKHGAIAKIFQPGDSVYAQVHQANTWQWESATVIERIGKVNVFLVDSQRLIRSHANQLKKRAADSVRKDSTPLSIFVDEFGLPSPTPVHDLVPAPESPVVPTASEKDSGESEYFSESDFEEEPILEPTVNNKPKRTVRLLARFEPYYLN